MYLKQLFQEDYSIRGRYGLQSSTFVRLSCIWAFQYKIYAFEGYTACLKKKRSRYTPSQQGCVYSNLPHKFAP